MIRRICRKAGRIDHASAPPLSGGDLSKTRNRAFPARIPCSLEKKFLLCPFHGYLLRGTGGVLQFPLLQDREQLARRFCVANIPRQSPSTAVATPTRGHRRRPSIGRSNLKLTIVDTLRSRPNNATNILYLCHILIRSIMRTETLSLSAAPEPESAFPPA